MKYNQNELKKKPNVTGNIMDLNAEMMVGIDLLSQIYGSL
jgi:hypothetical protein